jgi:hypothetical protein
MSFSLVMLPSCGVFCALAGIILAIFAVLIDGRNLTFELVGISSSWDMDQKAQAATTASIIYFCLSGVLFVGFAVLRCKTRRAASLAASAGDSYSKIGGLSGGGREGEVGRYGSNAIDHAQVDVIRSQRREQRRRDGRS